MGNIADQPAKSLFWFRECFLMPMPLGKKAASLRELLEYLRELDEPVLQYHLWQSRLAIAQPTVEYPNDFAFWAATALHDDRLAEKLSTIDPFSYENLTQIREAIVDLLEEYLWDFPHNPEVRPGFEFYFCKASIVIMRSGVSAQTLRQFCAALHTVGLDSVYYHCVEGRWRLAGKADDFSLWIETNFDLPALVAAIRDIDIYFYTLTEVRDTILSLIQEHTGETCDQPE
jgi:hypothetical protein